MAGRRPQPTKLTLLKGNPGRRPINQNEPQPEASIPECPPDLDERAHAEWDRMGKLLFEMGLLTKVDHAAMTAYCQVWSRWREAEANIVKFGAVIVGKLGLPMVSPYLRIANECLKQMRLYLVEFGMTPASRSRISCGKPAIKNSVLAFAKNKYK